MKLLIVESPTKAKTISKFLGKDYKVESSYGHVRDLPKGKMGVDTKHNFEPEYAIPDKVKKKINELKKLAKKSDTIYFATDEDREGEAIAWHIAQVLKLGKSEILNSKSLPSPKRSSDFAQAGETNSKFKIQNSKLSHRIVFHEITKKAIEEALASPREIDMKLVDSQQARRILDRLVGYELSPFLWRKVVRGLSAGRVQSVAVRLIVEREQEIEAFKPQEYWSVEAELKKRIKNQESGIKNFIAKLYKINDKILDKLAIKSKKEADEILKNLKGTDYIVDKIQKKEIKKNPPAPFITSTLQQEANQRLGFSTKQTMMLAQQLYEGIELGKQGSQGLITYMRTDSFNLADKFLGGVQKFIQRNYGCNYTLDQPRKFKKKSKLAQEAHEAIRPTEASRNPESIKKFLDKNQFRLYDLIWRRAVACQMKEARFGSTTVDITTEYEKDTKVQNTKNYIFRTTGSTIKFDGYLKIYPEKQKENILPVLDEKEHLELIKLIKNQHFTQPLTRYSEASLVKALEQNGIGRPSTYAPIISVIQTRNYVIKEDRRFKPTEIGILVNDVLVEHFPKVVDLKFTAHMEDDLDKIARGETEWVPVIKEFYKPFHENLMKKDKEISKKNLTEKATNEVCEKCGKPMIIKMGRYGKFLACTGYPECKNTQPLPGSPEAFAQESNPAANKPCEKCGAQMIVKHGRYGPFLACSAYPECKNIKAIKKSTGVKCPKCEKGEIVEKKSKKGRVFYACDQYPSCEFALWQKPTGEKCTECESLMVIDKDDTVKCSNKECGYEKISN